MKLTFIIVGADIILFSLVASQTSNLKEIGVRDLLRKFSQNDFKMKFERAEAASFNKKYLTKLHMVTFKHNRTSAAVNFTWIIATNIDKFDIVIQAYKFTSNEYRLFPLRFQADFCEAFKYNIIGLAEFKRCRNYTGCPFTKNVPATVCNWIPDEAKYPPFIPSGQYMVEIQAVYHKEDMFLIRGYGTIYRPVTK